MKNGFLVLILGFIFLPGFQCSKDNAAACYKARLEIKGICMHYTIKVLSSNIDTSLIEKEWKNPVTGKVYQNVFRLETLCYFPADISEGEEFYFTLNKEKEDPGCAVCMAYYPTPSKGLNIAVSKLPCN